MKLAANLPFNDAGRIIDLAKWAEELGLDSLWRGEAYGVDAVTPLAIAIAHTTRIRFGTAIMQMPARSPAMTAMTAISLDQLSNGRFLCGLGMSGPQVVEGWHGVPYRSPLGVTREYVEIVRRIFAGDERLTFEGTYFHVPYRGNDATGLGKPIRPDAHSRADIPVYLAAIGPKNVRLATEIADGLLPMLWNPYRVAAGLGDVLGDVDLGAFAITPTVPVAVGDDLAACRDKVRPLIAMYVGGMGAKGKNFYNSLVRRYGFEEAADKVQDAYLDGKRAEAVGMVPDQLVDELALVGSKARIAEHIGAWEASGIDTLIVAAPTRTNLEVLAELVL